MSRSNKSKLYALLPTERPNPRTRNIDRLNSKGIVTLINREDTEVARAVGRQSAAIARAVDGIVASLRRGGRLLFIGAGTSGRLAVLEAAECPPTFGTSPAQIRAVMAGGPRAVFRAREGAEDDARAGAAAVRKLRRGDVAIGIAASGVTPFVHGALRSAAKRGCLTIMVTSNGRPSNNPARITIAPQVGPEVIAGSTRLKSATAAKLVLNTLTTASMVRFGKVYDHWMVDLKLNSRKLRFRALRIISDLAGVGPGRAKSLLRQANGSVKVAVAMSRRDLSAGQARAALKSAGGSLRAVLEGGGK